VEEEEEIEAVAGLTGEAEEINQIPPLPSNRVRMLHPCLASVTNVYDVGDPTNAGNFVKIPRFLMTYTRKTYDHGARIAQSL
jgi:hypothetical protein